MKTAIKVIVMTTILCIGLCFISCFEHGGTIIVTNDFSNEKTVTVYSEFSIVGGILFSYKEKFSTKDIAPGESAEFIVSSNTEYGIVWGNDRYSYKIIEVSGGENVQVNIPWLIYREKAMKNEQKCREQLTKKQRRLKYSVVYEAML